MALLFTNVTLNLLCHSQTLYYDLKAFKNSNPLLKPLVLVFFSGLFFQIEIHFHPKAVPHKESIYVLTVCRNFVQGHRKIPTSLKSNTHVATPKKKSG